MNLFPYQVAASVFLQQKKRGYLALDMGMGKTITALDAAYKAGKRHILLIAEKNEIVNSQNFRREVESHFENLTYHSLREVGFDFVRGSTRSVCGINPDGLVKYDPDDLEKMFDSVIIDEATLAKTTTTQRFKRVYRIAMRMEHVYLLSGTPMMNGAAELYAPLLLLDHPMVSAKGVRGRLAFETIFAGGHRRKIRNTGVWFKDYVWWAKGANHVRELRYLLREHFFILSKTGTNVFKKKVRTIERVPMTVSWVAEYVQAWETYLEDASKRDVDMDNVTELRNLIENGQCYQVNSRWKALRVAEDIASGKYGSRRIVVFSMFIETDEIIQSELARLGVSFRTFEDVKEWKAGDEQVLVCRIKAHGKGGNVPEASVALFVDMDFVPSNNIQAENRIDRPEQKDDMLIVYYLTEGNDVVDEHVRKINQDKARKIEQFMKPLANEEMLFMESALAAIRSKHPKSAEILGI